jgi:hypothetical protein
MPEVPVSKSLFDEISARVGAKEATFECNFLKEMAWKRKFLTGQGDQPKIIESARRKLFSVRV